MNAKSQRKLHRSTLLQRKTLALAIGSIALGFAGGAFAQATTGTIHGTVPVVAGETIQITGTGGFNRTITVGPSGKYSMTVPVGVYTVTLLQNGKAVHTRNDVAPAAAGAVNVSFHKTSNVQTLSAVNVSANAIPPIDVSTTTQVTTFNRAQLQRLPIAHSAQAIAMLSPGVLSGASSLGVNPTNGSAFLSVGGASTAENAYYIDGMNTTDFENGQGNTVVLPYFAIQQQQTMTSGYSAKYGRSIGGVISQIGRSGSNQWHFGFRAEWEPRNLAARPRNWNFANPFYVSNPAAGFVANPAEVKGQLGQYRRSDQSWETVYDGYVSGPIVKNKLTFFLGYEQDETRFNAVGTAFPMNTNPIDRFEKRSSPKIYAKINWNINENNILSITGLQSSFNTWNNEYNFPYSVPYNQLGPTTFLTQVPPTKNKFRMWVANYTSFITNNLTLHAMLGKTNNEQYTVLAPAVFDPSLPDILDPSQQNSAFTPNGPIVNSQPTLNYNDPGHVVRNMNYRVSLDYKWRNNTFSVGIDNIQTWDELDGSHMSGPGYAWLYGASAPSSPVSGTVPDIPPYVGPPDSNGPNPGGYWVAKYIFDTPASIRVAQRAYYLEDKFQVTPDLLLNLGIRDSQFTNYNPAKQPYISLHKPQWAPRFGFSWNVFGNSTLKVFGNAGRYYLDLPAAVALRDAGAPQFTEQFYTYSGINATGIPQGLVPLPQNNGGHGPDVGISANNEYGEPLNPDVVAARNIGAEYQDNFALGADKEFKWLGSSWVGGLTAKYQKLGRIVDDWGDQQKLCEVAMAQGVTYPGATLADRLGYCSGVTDGSLLFNPGVTNIFDVMGGDGQLHKVTITPADQGFPKVKRDYYSLDLSLSHPYNGKWFGKVDVIWSRDWGNEEGPVDSIIGQSQSSVSATEAWDFPQLMQFSDGLLPNDQKWQIVAYGEYTINPEWNVGGTLLAGSGHPLTCLGFLGVAQNDPLGYTDNGSGGAYHWCYGSPVPPGNPVPGATGMTPWTEQLNLNIQYSPKFADHKLTFVAQVFNVFNQQRTTQYYYGTGTNGPTLANFSPYPFYLSPYGSEQPRFVKFEVRYDF